MGEGQWRRHRGRPGRPARRQSGRRHGDAERRASTPIAPANSCQVGYLGGTPYFGRDLNGDGDLLDTVRVLAPSQTADPALGRQRLAALGHRPDRRRSASLTRSIAAVTARPARPASSRSMASRSRPSRSMTRSPRADGDILEKRDRLSIALLNQIGGEYRGEFFDSRLTVNVGAPRAVLLARPQQQLRDVERQRLRRMLRHATRPVSPPSLRPTRSTSAAAYRGAAGPAESACSTIMRSCRTSA